VNAAGGQSGLAERWAFLLANGTADFGDVGRRAFELADRTAAVRRIERRAIETAHSVAPDG
jgi:hypothetical protein